MMPLEVAATSDFILVRAFFGCESSSSSFSGFLIIFFYLGATGRLGVGFLAEEKSLGRFESGRILKRFPSSSVSSKLPALAWPAN